MTVYINGELLSNSELNDIHNEVEMISNYQYSYHEDISEDKIGDFYDTSEDNSIFGFQSQIRRSLMSVSRCYPRYSGPITVTSSNSGWWGGAVTVIIGKKFTLDNAAAVDAGGGYVQIPCTGHEFFEGETIYISGSVNYNGIYTISEDGTIGVNTFTISATYVAETFAGTEKVISEINSNYQITGVEVSDISDNGNYELVLWRGAIGETVPSQYEIARIPLFKSASHTGIGIYPIKTELLYNPDISYPYFNKIGASLLSSNTAVNTAKIKLIYNTVSES